MSTFLYRFDTYIFSLCLGVLVAKTLLFAKRKYQLHDRR